MLPSVRFYPKGQVAIAGFRITRAAEWIDSNSCPIALDEWTDYVRSDTEMRLDGFAEAEFTDGILRMESPGIAVWIAYSEHNQNGRMAWFYWTDGQIQVKNPDKEIIRKMYSIAQSLGARVLGDDGEFYEQDGRSLDVNSTIASDSKVMPKKSWWMRLLGRSDS